MLGLLVTLAMSLSTAQAAPSDGGVSAMTQIQAEFVAQQNWMVDSLWNDFGVEASAKDYSPESLRQLRNLHDAFRNNQRNNQPIRFEQFNQIQIVCRKAPC